MGEANPLALTDRSSDPAMHVGKQRINGYGTETPFIPELPGLQKTTTRNYQRQRLRSDSRPALGPPLPSQQTQCKAPWLAHALLWLMFRLSPSHREAGQVRGVRR